MKFLMMIKHAEGAPGLEHPEGLYAAMGKFVDESFKSGILKDTAGLKRTEHGYRIKSKGGTLTRIDGPFTESKEVVGGYAIVETKTQAEADALALRDRYHAGTVSAHGLAVSRGHLIARLGVALERPTPVADVRRFAAHLGVEFPAIFTFLFDPTLDATNWRAEQAIRPAVVTRKMAGGGNRTAHGAQTQQVLTSLLRTAHQRDLDATPLIVDLLRAQAPIVVLQTPAQ